MNTDNKKSAQILLANRQATVKKQRLSIGSRPENSEQALVIQAEMIKQCNDGIKAWKCLLPLNEEQLVVAPIFADTVQSGEDCALFADHQKARIEPEIAFLLGLDLPAKSEGYSELEIDNAIKSCHMALELIEDRFAGEENVSFYEKLADCLANQGLFIGPEIDKQDAYCASNIMINIDQADNKQHFTAKHPNTLPQNPLYWLINFMTKRGIGFTAGQAIITGSYAGVVEVAFNCITHVSYEGLGRYSVIFKEK